MQNQFFRRMRFYLSLLLCSTIFLTYSCGGDGTAESGSQSNIAAGSEAELKTMDTIQVVLNSNDKMQFDLDLIKVWEGQVVHLTLHHTGTLPLESMGHNFVLIDNGISVRDFAKNTVGEKDHDYLPADKSNVIAHTDMIGGGATTEVTFTAPAVGSYDYLCSFPGHASIMKGKFIVQTKN